MSLLTITPAHCNHWLPGFVYSDMKIETIIELAEAYNKTYSMLKSDFECKQEQTSKRALETNSEVTYTLPLYEGDDVSIIHIKAAPGIKRRFSLYKIQRHDKQFSVLGWSDRDQSYLYFTDHFFMRYAQRLALPSKSMIEVVKHFVIHEPAFTFDKPHGDDDDLEDVVAAFDFGWVACNKSVKRFMSFKTFIPDKILSSKKRKIVKELRRQLLAA